MDLDSWVSDFQTLTSTQPEISPVNRYRYPNSPICSSALPPACHQYPFAGGIHNRVLVHVFALGSPTISRRLLVCVHWGGVIFWRLNFFEPLATWMQSHWMQLCFAAQEAVSEKKTPKRVGKFDVKRRTFTGGTLHGEPRQCRQPD